MSHKWTGWIDAVIEALPTDRDTDAPAATIPPHLFKLWLVLARYADGDGTAWPSITTLARRINCNRRNTTRALAEGEAAGLWTRKRVKGGSRDTTRYCVHRLRLGAQTTLVTRGADNPRTRGADDPRLGAHATPRTNPRNKPIQQRERNAARPSPAKPKRPRPADPFWDTTARLFFGGTVAEPHRGRCGKLAKAFKQLTDDPDDIRQRLERYRLTWPNAADTPEAILKHWDRFAEPVGILDADPVTPPDEVFYE